MDRGRVFFRHGDVFWRTGSDGLDRQPDHGASIARSSKSVASCDDPELEDESLKKTAGLTYSFWTSAYPDQRPEISHLPLFSYDRLSKGLPEKGWVWPPESYLSKPVIHT